MINGGYYQEPKFILSNKPSFSFVLRSRFAILAELKIRSPNSKKYFSPVEVEQRLKMMGTIADGLSILTEPNYFLGSLEYLTEVSKYNLPILMKDIVISAKQIQAGQNASAVLLIAKVLNSDQIEDLISCAKNFKLEVILEVDNELDFQKYVDCGAQIMAINNRNLSTFKVDLEVSNRIMSENITNKPVIGFSGYSSSHEIIKAKEAGLSGVLIGSSISQHTSPDIFLGRIKKQVADVYV